MRNCTKIRIRLLAFMMTLAGSCLTSQTQAEDYRIETRVYATDEEEFSSESVTLFTGGVAYDFRDADNRVTIFRPGVADKPGRFLLIDTKREIKTEIAAEQIAIVMTKLRRWAALQEDSFLRFTGDPVFQESFNPATGELKMTSQEMSYRLVTMPVSNEKTMSELRAFLDAFAQLHTLLEAGLPPAPRLLVNEALDKRDIIPVEVELYSGPISDKPSIRAEHMITWKLSKMDRDRIDQAQNQLAEFKEVDNSFFSKKNLERLATSEASDSTKAK